MDTNSWVLWVGVIAAVIHVFEEYALGWISWANEELGPKFGIEVDRTDFFVASVYLVFIALAAAAIGWWAPAVSLAVPALFILNAVFFHMLPTARSERITPGTISAVFIYLPVGAWMFWAAGADDRLSFGAFVLAFVLGAFLMAWPMAMLYLKSRIGWDANAPVADPEDGSSNTVAVEPEPVPEPGQASDEPEDDTILLSQDAAVEAPDTEEPTTELRRD